MSRLQLAINVANLSEAIAFYSKMFATEPARTRPGYANFSIDEPPLKLVLFEGEGAPGSINHLGVETNTAEEVDNAARRLEADDLSPTAVEDTACCYATKTETWVEGPDGLSWEWYVRTGDSEQFENLVIGGSGTDATPDDCCT
jgi:catechol 2,3-dioxygenase-like lactoylglutathione lyase family enzyme